MPDGRHGKQQPPEPEARLILIPRQCRLPSPSRVGSANQPTGSGERSRTMIIIGVDFHPEFQQIAFVDTETGELQERRLNHPNEAESFYRELVSRSFQVRVGMEASGQGRWLERLLGELGIELWVGDAAEIRTR